MADKHLAGGRSPGEIAEHELLGPGSGIPVREDEKKKATPRHEEPRRPEQRRRKEEDAPRGIAEIDIHTGRTVHEEHTPEIPGEGRTRPPQDRTTRR